MPTSPLSSGSPPHIIVCGLGRFGLRVVECLREQAPDIPITLVTDNVTREDRLKRAEKLGIDLIIGDFRFAEIRAKAGITQASALLLCSSSDADSLATALDVRGEAPNIRILMRMDDDRIAERLMSDFGIDLVLSPPVLAARQFSHAALAAISEATNAAEAKHHHSTHNFDQLLRLPNRYDSRRPVMILGLVLITLFVSGITIFKNSLGLSTIDAIYFTATILTTVGFGDFHLREAAPFVKLFGTLLMFGGVTMIALLTSFVTNFVLSGAPTRLRAESFAGRAHDHVIVCGLGTIGFEIVRDLSEQGIPTVVVDNSPDSSAARLLEGRVAVIFGDAFSEETLLRAGVLRARALIACVSEDAKNLEIGLTAQTLAQARGPHRPLRLVLRCFDADTARRIHAASRDYTLLSSAEIAAPVFARAALAPSGVSLRQLVRE